MAVQGGLKLVKFLLFFFNFIFWLCGIALIVVGIIVQIAMHNSPVMKNASGSVVPLIIIGVGVLILIVSTFGCCGAWKESYCMVTTFAILITVLIIVEIAAAIAAYVFRKQVHDLVNDGLRDMIRKYNNKGTPEFKKGMDNLQIDLKCCGANSSSDWVNFAKDKVSVPDSCCKNVTKNCGLKNMHNKEIVYQKGCRIAFEKLLMNNILWVAVAALVIAFLQILGIVFACLLMKGIKSGYESMG